MGQNLITRYNNILYESITREEIPLRRSNHSGNKLKQETSSDEYKSPQSPVENKPETKAETRQETKTTGQQDQQFELSIVDE